MWLHLDNCRVHNLKAALQILSIIQMKRAPQPAYSPDLAPSDFLLFVYVKTQLRGYSFRDRVELESKIVEILNPISEKFFRSVFEEWLHRCLWVFEHNGAYYHK